MARPASEQPTDAELEILRVLWERGPLGLGAVHATIVERRPVALTTIATTLKTMLAKGLVGRDDGPRGYVWSARASQQATASGMLGKVLNHVFDGSARRLVAHLIEQGALTDRERAEIRALLESATEPAPTSSRVRSRRKGGQR